MTEKKMWERMRFKLGAKLFLQRIESRTGLGILDVAYTKSALASGWIEFKVIKKFPKKERVVIPFRPGQLSWIHQYIKYSKHIYVFLHIENLLYIFMGNKILAAYSKQNMHMLSCYDALWRQVDWKEVFNLL